MFNKTNSDISIVNLTVQECQILFNIQDNTEVTWSTVLGVFSDHQSNITEQTLHYDVIY